MKRLIALVAISLIVISVSPVLASTITSAIWHTTFTVFNNGTESTGVSSNITLSTSNLINNKYANSATDFVAQIAGVDIPFAPSINASYPWCFYVGTIPAYSSKVIDLYSGNVTGGKIRVFPVVWGCSVPDTPAFEPGDNFTFELAGYIDTAIGADKYLIYKNAAIQVFVSPTVSGNITAQITGGAVATATGVSSGEHTLVVSANTTHLEIRVDGVLQQSTALGGVPVPNNANTWYFAQNDSMPYFEYVLICDGKGKQVYYETGEDFQQTSGGSDDYWAQTFNATSTGYLKSVSFLMNKELGTWTTVQLKAVDGTGKPTGSALASANLTLSHLPADFDPPIWNTANFTTDYKLITGTQYAIVLPLAAGYGNGSYYFWLDSTAPTYTGGTLWRTQSGLIDTGYDAMFRVYVDNWLDYWDWEYSTTFTGSISSVLMTPNFRTNSSDADVSGSFVSLDPTTTAQVDNWTVDTSYSILTNALTTPTNMYAGKDWSKIPGADVVNDVLTEAQVPESAWWYPFLFIGIGVIGLCVYGGTTLVRGPGSSKLYEGGVDGSLLAMFITCEVLLIAFGILKAIPIWPAFVFPLGALAIIMSRKHYSWS